MKDPRHKIRTTRHFTIAVDMWGPSEQAIAACLKDIKREAVRVSHRKVLDRRYSVEMIGARIVQQTRPLHTTTRKAILTTTEER